MPPEMDPEEIQRRMKTLRNSLDFDVERVASSVRAKTDWRYLVSSHPWLTLGAATAVGYLAVPRRVEKVVSDVDMLRQLAKEGKIMLAPQGITNPKSESWANKLFAVALAMGSRAAVSYATNFLSQAFEQASQKRSANDSEHDSTYAGAQPR
ncbi:hypothetical protein [Bythopirellula polymerisocia]|uniref:Uncharacterized protein n=1 Tax=Bythopirellula polymerisocia TaxID=2528003 RepID=A0A5C6CSX5_9BACT|nr:hypothetical protein [Bythopirellula polymerisocia]TWU27680.1 hypothetical protein Pla144_24570 [Bythopirellula polymerisocia]